MLPQYHFHLEGGGAFFADETDRVELPDDEAARTHATKVAGELAMNTQDPNRIVVVSNDKGKPIFKICLRDAQ